MCKLYTENALWLFFDYTFQVLAYEISRTRSDPFLNRPSREFWFVLTFLHLVVLVFSRSMKESLNLTYIGNRRNVFSSFDNFL